MKLITRVTAIIALATLVGCTTTTQHTARTSGDECIVRNGRVFDAAGHPMAGCIARWDGVYMTTFTGKLELMKQNTMMNGIKCLVDGTCVMKDGSRLRLKNGELMTPEGKILHIKRA